MSQTWFASPIWIVGAMMVGTVITRFLPFLLFPGGKELPGFIQYLAGTLPYAVMGMLVVYCLKGVDLTVASSGLAQGLAVAAIVLIHRWKGNALLSIGVGTVFYMVLVQGIFA